MIHTYYSVRPRNRTQKNGNILTRIYIFRIYIFEIKRIILHSYFYFDRRATLSVNFVESSHWIYKKNDKSKDSYSEIL